MLEALRAAARLAQDGISAEVIDLRSVSPVNMTTVFDDGARVGDEGGTPGRG